jgi:hypothetical protein
MKKGPQGSWSGLFSDALMHVNSIPRIFFLSKSLSDGGMATIDQIYRDNLRLLAKEAGGQDGLAERIGKSPAQVSQWINASKDSKTKKPRVLSRQMARHIEAKFPKPEGWMDQPHEAEKPIKGAFLHAITAEEQMLIDHFKHLLPSDRIKKIKEIAELAKERQEQRKEMLSEAGLDRIRAQAADTHRGRSTSSVDVTDKLKQRSLLDTHDK